MLPMLMTDGYKLGHRFQYPKGTELIYSNFTARCSRMPEIKEVVFYGLQSFLKEILIKRFNEDFFNKPKEEAIKEYKRVVDSYLGKDSIDVSHIGDLHDLGYLPVEIKALAEGTLCPLRVPMLTIKNTKPEFFWVTNYLETILSTSIWHPITIATIAHQYKKILKGFELNTSDMEGFSDWQGHDFSMRGMTIFEDAAAAGSGHLLSFTGTDTIPAILYLEKYYNADCEKELIGASVAASEHSVMSLGGKETEYDTYHRLITEVYPKGIVSIVSDTWDYWKVLTETLPALKDKIMARDGKLVCRPDSGDPVKVVCGENYPSYDNLKDAIMEFDAEFEDDWIDEDITKIIRVGDDHYKLTYSAIDNKASSEVAELTPEQKGTIQVLWETFGGTVNSKGYKQLDPHIGCIYGDSITLERCEEICKQLAAKGFASTNMVFGIGSYSYQYVTRDTFGFAVKSTYGVVNGKAYNIFKDPKTDDGTKKSAKGLLSVIDIDGKLTLLEEVSPYQEQKGLLETVFINGMLLVDQSLAEIRAKLKGTF